MKAATKWILGGITVALIVGKSTQHAIYSDQTKNIAAAISFAEGTTRADGSLVTGSLGIRNNNPGDILDSQGNMITYATLDDGWNALYHQVDLMLTGKSRVYQPGMSIVQVAGDYTGGDNPAAWAAAVAQYLGASITDAIAEVGLVA